MSYILEALKKAHEKRPPGPIPDLFTVQGPLPEEPHRVPAVVVTAAVLLLGCGVILGGWLWLQSGRRAEPRPAPPVPGEQNSAVGETPRALVEAAPPAQVVPAGPTPTTAAPSRKSRLRPVQGRPESSTAQPPAAAPAGAGSAEFVPAAPVVSSTWPAAPAPAVPVVRSTVPSAPAPAVPAFPPADFPPAAVPETPPEPLSSTPLRHVPSLPPPFAVSPALPPPPEPPPAEPTPEVPPPADGRVVGFADLPPAVKAELAGLQISGHVWSVEPSLRLLTIQDRLVHEGAEAAPGVRLEEITEQGAVFVYRGWRFRITGF